MEDNRFAHAVLLYNQRRYADAEKALRDILAGDPQQGHALHLLAATYLQQDRHAEARNVAQQVLGMRPHSADAHNLLARIELADGAPAKAEEHAKQAVELDPGDSSHHAILAFVHLRRSEHTKALESADRGLAIDPEDIQCLNIRTEALARLGRKEEADRTIDKSLELDPENPYTHSNTGWAVLRRGDHTKALDHFREALRRDPMNAHAKAGMVEALKARYWIYRLWLRYMFWVSNLKGNVQVMLMVGLYLLNRLLNSLIDSNPALAPFLYPILIAYLLFALSTWILVPVSNLFLRFNKYGRYALDKEETLSSTLTGVALGISVLAFLGWLVIGGAGPLTLCGVGFLMMIPLGSMLRPGRKHRWILVGACIILAALGLFGTLIASSTSIVLNGIIGYFLTGLLIYQFGASFLASRD